MSVGVMMPQKKQKSSPLGAIGTIGGAIAGGVAGMGNPAGIAGGAALGSQLGGTAGSLVGGAMAPQQSQPMGAQSGNAMERRKAELDMKPLEQIRDSIDALGKTNDPQLQQAYAKPLMQAEAMAKRGYG